MTNDLRKFDSLLIDIDGVIIQGREEIPGASTALKDFVSRGVDIVFVTNNVSVRKSDVENLIQGMIPGFQIRIIDPLDVFETKVIQEQPHLIDKCMVLGSPIFCERLKTLGCKILDPKMAEDASLVLVGSLSSIDYDQLSCACRAIMRGAIFFGTGRERVYFWREKLWPSTGSILAAIETATRKEAIILGKPFPEIFKLARNKLSKKSKTLVIGDDLDVDIAGAKIAGLDCALVLSSLTNGHPIQNYANISNYLAQDLLSLSKILYA